jgi:hypothetical protein
MAVTNQTVCDRKRTALSWDYTKNATSSDSQLWSVSSWSHVAPEVSVICLEFLLSWWKQLSAWSETCDTRRDMTIVQVTTCRLLTMGICLFWIGREVRLLPNAPARVAPSTPATRHADVRLKTRSQFALHEAVFSDSILGVPNTSPA